ncbi:MAG TPA: hypothetical protein VF202_01145 [Trueperaceae bacterium]
MSAVKPEPGSRLDSLLAEYAALKPQVDELTSRFNAVKDAIKVELTTAAPEARQIRVTHDALGAPLRLSYIESWRVDAKRLKAEDPATYVRYAVKSARWELRGGA